MIYEIVAGGQTWITMDTSNLARTGIHYGSANLPVRREFDYYSGFPNTYIYPGTRTVYVPATGGSGNAQYLRITSVTARPDIYYDTVAVSGLSTGGLSILLMAVIAVCSLLTIFFRR